MTELRISREAPSEIIANVSYQLKLLDEINDGDPPDVLPEYVDEVSKAANLAEGVEIARRWSRERLLVERIPIWGDQADSGRRARLRRRAARRAQRNRRQNPAFGRDFSPRGERGADGRLRRDL